MHSVHSLYSDHSTFFTFVLIGLNKAANQKSASWVAWICLMVLIPDVAFVMVVWWVLNDYKLHCSRLCQLGNCISNINTSTCISILYYYCISQQHNYTILYRTSQLLSDRSNHLIGSTSL